MAEMFLENTIYGLSPKTKMPTNFLFFYCCFWIFGIVTARWDMPPIPTHHSNILLCKGLYTCSNSNPNFQTAGLMCYQYTKVPRCREVRYMCPTCSLSALCVTNMCLSPREWWGNQHVPGFRLRPGCQRDIHAIFAIPPSILWWL